ncbi:hypothetical protein Bca52824_033233 [Brassica carinata]|uniref:Uncharacterized protein n=1 Tax=Brassica carinata TaxID=52824 RepID=A0A8X7SDY3_BRACI|nr:hypothetical protein Bca52824_033233 [Brassica carinata]
MADAQKLKPRCTYDVPVETGKSCDPQCVYFCKKLFGPVGRAVCEKELKGYCQCSAICKGSR